MNNKDVSNTNPEPAVGTVAAKPTISPRPASALQKDVSPAAIVVSLLLIAAVIGGYFLWQQFRPLLSESMTTAELSAKIKKGQTLAELQTVAGQEVENLTVDSPETGLQSVYHYRTRDGNIFVAFDVTRDTRSSRVQTIKTTPLRAAPKDGAR